MTKQPQKNVLENHLAKIEAELQQITEEFKRLESRGKELLARSKGNIDDSKLFKIRTRLGILK